MCDTYGNSRVLQLPAQQKKLTLYTHYVNMINIPVCCPHPSLRHSFVNVPQKKVNWMSA